MEITNKQKAEELATKFDWNAFIANDYTLKKCIEEAMDWKDEQYKQEKQRWIDKAAEWFGKYLFDIGYPDDWLRDSPNMTNGETRFKQAMKGE